MQIKKISKLELVNLRNGILFALPFFIGFICFTIYPVISSLYYSFCKYTIVSTPQWIGFKNYIKLFTEDELFKISLYNSLYYAAFTIPLTISVAIVSALLLNVPIKGQPIFRTIFYLPSITPVVASSILWVWILNPQYGVLNAFLEKLGINGPGWLADPRWSKPALILMSLWGIGGSIVIFLAALQDVPQELYESAELDGANWWNKLWAITIPSISPAILFTLIMGMIGTLQFFAPIYVMTNGGPVNSTTMYAFYLYRQAFVYLDMGYASSMAWILFVIVLLGTILMFKSSSRWVYYRGER
jgi:multiple sugar transport system permease protein